MRRMLGWALIGGALLPVAGCAVAAQKTASPIPVGKASPVAWKESLSQPPAWYAGAEAVRIGDNVLLYQRETGGWAKNIDMAEALTEKEKADLRKQKKEAESTIDNGATYTQMGYLARVYNATRQERFRDGFLRGLDYLLAAQYDNGGWPQYYPLRTGYYTHITFIAGAMVGALTLLRGVARKERD